MNVEDWLRQSGLSGKKLEHAVASAEENFVESIAELKALAATAGSLFLESLCRFLLRIA